jgi:hypothetical protein
MLPLYCGSILCYDLIMKTNVKQSLSLIESWLDRKGFVLCKSKKTNNRR